MLNGEGSEEGKKATISLISSVDIKVKSKKKDSALLLFFLPEISGNHTIYRQSARVLETRNLTSAYMKGVGWGWGDLRTILSEPKFLGWIVQVY